MLRVISGLSGSESCDLSQFGMLLSSLIIFRGGRMFKLLKDGMSLEPADPIENLLPPSAEDNDLRNLSSRSTRFYPWACLKISEPIGCIVDRRFILMALSAFDLSINSSI